MLTLSMIVKNEERYLRDCLNSVKGIADEIVIVDTGSEDRTIEIAAEFGAVVYNFKWKNDFAAARNFALDHSNGDWILYLDADERLNTESRDELKRLTSVKSYRGYYCGIINISDFEHSSSVMNYVRLFPNDPRVRFTGKIHEQITSGLINGDYKTAQANIRITHIGYNLEKDGLKSKAQRNLSILLNEYEKNPGGYYAFHLGQTFHFINDKRQAVNYFKIALRDNILEQVYKANALRYLAIDYADQNNLPEALEYINDSLANDGEQVLSLLAASKIYNKLNKREEALSFVSKALKLNRQFREGEKISEQNSLIDDYSIILLGLQIAVGSQNTTGINNFHSELELLKCDDRHAGNKEEIEFLISMVEQKKIKEALILKLHDYIGENSVEPFFILLKYYKYKEDLTDRLLEISGKYQNSAQFMNALGVYLYEINKFDEAEKIFIDAVKINNNPSPVFYLVSLYLKRKNFYKISELLKNSLHKFENSPSVTARLHSLQKKLTEYL